MSFPVIIDNVKINNARGEQVESHELYVTSSATKIKRINLMTDLKIEQ